MALEKTITYHNGTVATYHKITGIRLRAVDTPYQVVLEVSSYTDKDYREQHIHNTVNVGIYHVTMEQSEIDVYPIFPLAYSKLKNLEEFLGSKDV